MRNEITASRQNSMKRLHRSSRSHRLLAGDALKVSSQCSNHACDEGRSRAPSLENYISLRISWVPKVSKCPIFSSSSIRSFTAAPYVSQTNVPSHTPYHEPASPTCPSPSV